MLTSSVVFTNIAVKDIEDAKEFYGETLGLGSGEENPGGISYNCGKGTFIFVMQTDTAGSAKNTVATWFVDDIAALVSELEAKGVKFIDYDYDWAERTGHIHVMGDSKSAWFQDPTGNILALLETGS